MSPSQKAAAAEIMSRFRNFGTDGVRSKSSADLVTNERVAGRKRNASPAVEG